MPHSNKTPSMLRVPAFSTPPEEVTRLVKQEGGVVLEGFLTKEQVARMNAEIDGPLEKISAGSTHSAEHIRKFHGAQTKRMTNVVNHSRVFREEVLDHDYIHSMLAQVFHIESGTYWMASHQVIEIGPGNTAQVLHRDQGQYQLPNRLGPDGPECVINFLIALTDCTEQNGATRVIPGSHRWEDFYEKGTPEQTVPAELNAGDILMITGKVIHGGGANLTQNEHRRVISWSFIPSYFTPEEAYPFIVPMESVKKMSPRAQRILGFRSQYPKNSPGLWQSDYSELATVLGLEGEDKEVQELKALGRR
ncbi:conserved hypothetical protein [Uncinocarpus reesii 1704]|uniref:Phytanoyl-CoA dioxygenase n=1 Tax=Uncinocarpus reesii (strain UAMH 1704) TaxID=336963 RepID=C4JX70_UNCRE|nr:uncharacterized protein UREG_06243 [Uncinocarpus reesii 1704]EEP81378.1 conserved hypothetical protein [Uncinocarpus reesii 1704]